MPPVRLSGVRVPFRDEYHFSFGSCMLGANDMRRINPLHDINFQHATSEHRPESVLSNISFRLDMFHDQLPLAVPCYDLLPVTEFTVVLREARCRVPPASLS